MHDTSTPYLNGIEAAPNLGFKPLFALHIKENPPLGLARSIEHQHLLFSDVQWFDDFLSDSDNS